MTNTPEASKANVKDVADFFKVSTRTVRRWVRFNNIPHTRIGKVLRFNLTEVVEWSKRQKAL